jgi:2-amino-4-hydroxy-6-hydroxymethyldihydropteridine diphosphokinase
MTIVYIGLGSNMDLPRRHINSAIQSLGEIQSTRMISTSLLYKSKPLGPQNQDDYINAVVKLDTELEAIELLDCLQVIENEHGRVRNEHWGPRTLDLDILMFGEEIIKNDRLTVPHPEIANRSFVLVPLAEIDSACVIPEKGLVSDLLSGVDQNSLEILQ